MCNHKYSIDRHVSTGDKCPYTQLYHELPLDENGVCLFHSDDLNWKRENKFTTAFLQLVRLLDENSDKKYYDFAEFVFVGESLKSNKNSEPLVFKLSKAVFKKEAKFSGALFTDPVELLDVQFQNGANFAGAAFKDTLIVRKCSVGGSIFDEAVFEKNTYFEDTHFSGAYTTFICSVFNSLTKFTNSNFDGMAIFSEAIFNKSRDLDAATEFRNVAFNNTANFTDCVFYCPVQFQNVEFNLNAEFLDTSFRASKSSLKFSQADAVFYDIGLNENGLLIFEGTSSENKIFSDTDVEIRFKKDIKGTIRLKNVNFSNLSNVSRKRLIQLSKEGKVVIGPGCIKYRFQTETKTILIGKDNQFLILEITQTFKNYFTSQNGLNLGFEIVSREDDRISFFYFTDEDIAEAEFLDRLKKTEQDLWDLIGRNPGNNHYLPGQTNDTYGLPKSTKENVLINTIDGISALMSTFFRVAIRISVGRWKEKDTKSLVNAINFDSKGSVVNPGYIHQMIINNYSQKVLFGIKNNQTQDIQQLK